MSKEKTEKENSQQVQPQRAPSPAPDPKTMEKVKQIDNLIMTIYNYPVFTDYEKKEEAKKALIKMYKKEDQVIKNTILFILHEKLCSAKEYRDFHNFEGMKMRYKEEDANKVRQGIFRRVFDYAGSLEGIFETFDILGKFDDVFSIKLVSYHLSRYMLVNSFETQVLSEKAISVLGESNNTYALRVLLSLAPFFYGKEKVVPIMIDALSTWAEKLDRLKMSEKEKNELKKEIKKYIEMEEKRVEYYG
ncbi:MAG: hypothetical protein QXY05_04090 [Candidatus Anstonellales archaeon]